MKRAKRRTAKPRLCFSGSALLKDATVNNDSKLVAELIESKERLGITNNDFNQSLIKASKHGCTDCTRIILTKVNSIEVDYQDEDLWTPLHMATASNHEEIVQLLIKAKADPTLLDIDGNFALDYAFNPRIKDLLIHHMAECGVYSTDLPSIKSRLPNAMKVAVANGLRRNKDMNAHNKNGVSPLHTAAANGYTEVVKMLIHSGAHLDLKDNEGYTPLSVSVKYRQLGVAKQLIENGADTTVLDSKDLANAKSSTANGQSTSASLMTHLMKNKLSSISHEDQTREYQHLKESGYAVDHHDRHMQLEAIRLASLYNSTSPDMIYEEVGSVTSAPSPNHNSAQLVADQYDTFANVKQEMNQHHLGDDEDMYDDALSVRQLMGLMTTTQKENYEDDGLYDDAVSIRHSMGLSTTAGSDLNDEGLYDDAVSIRHSMGVDSSSGGEGKLPLRQLQSGSSSEMDVDLNFEELLYDDTASIQAASIVNKQVPNQNDMLYDDAITVQEQMKQLANDKTLSSNGLPHDNPQPYLKAKPTAPDVYTPTAPFSPERRRKMTTRRGRLPKTKKQSNSSSENLQKQPLPEDGSPVLPQSPQRSPILKNKKSLRQQATVLSDNVPIAWQFKLNATKQNEPQSSSPGTTPTQQPHPPIRHDRNVNHLQLSVPTFHNMTSNHINSSSPMSSSPLFERSSNLSPVFTSGNHFPHPMVSSSSSSFITPPNSASSHVSRSVSPTYMMIPEQPNIYESMSSSSGEYSNPRVESPRVRSPHNLVDGGINRLESGIKKMQLSSRNSVPAFSSSINSSTPPPPPPSRRHNGHAPRPPPRPARLSSPFDI